MEEKNHMYRNPNTNLKIVLIKYFSSNDPSKSKFNKITTIKRVESHANR